MEGKLLYEKLTFIVRGLLFKIHNELGRFLSEKQYGDAFELSLKQNNIPYKRELVLPVSFEGEKNGRNRIDFLLDDKIIIELKCVSFLDKDHYFQCQRYLNSYNLDLALLINFRSKYLTIHRILNANNLNHHP